MITSRGMGAINPAKIPNGKKMASGGKVGLYANINAKRERGAKPRKKGAPGAPTDQAFIDSAKTAKSK
jgi:hypothetical protein